MFDKLLAVFIGLSVLSYASGIGLYTFADRYLMIGTICLVALALILCEPKRRLVPAWPALFMLYCVWHVFSRPFHPLSQHALFNIFFAIAIFYLTMAYAEDIRWTIGAIVGVSVINMAWAIGQQHGFDLIFNANEGLPAGFLIDHQSLAGYIALSAPLFAFYLYGLPILAPVLFCVSLNNFTALFANLISAVFTAARRPYPHLIALSVLGFSLVGLCIQNKAFGLMNKIALRFDLWEKTLSQALTAPLSGYGLGRFVEFGSKINPETNVNYFTAKSDYIEFGHEIGPIPAVGIIIAIAVILINRYRRAVKTFTLRIISASIISFSIMLLAQSHLRNPKIAPTFMVILAWFYILTENKQEA